MADPARRRRPKPSAGAAAQTRTVALALAPLPLHHHTSIYAAWSTIHPSCCGQRPLPFANSDTMHVLSLAASSLYPIVGDRSTYCKRKPSHPHRRHTTHVRMRTVCAHRTATAAHTNRRAASRKGAAFAGTQKSRPRNPRRTSCRIMIPRIANRKINCNQHLTRLEHQ
jgi:hypothetical protein